MITDRQIKSAVAAIENGRQRVELRDPGVKGAGRLLLVVRRSKQTPIDAQNRATIINEWYAVYHRGGKRKLTKIGSYPDMSLQAARAKFQTDYSPAILKGANPTNPYARAAHNEKDITLKALFEAYVASLKLAGKRSWYSADRILLSRVDNAADALGGNRAANSISPMDIQCFLAEMHSSGPIAMAHNARCYLRAAFQFGMGAQYDYTRAAVAGRWNLVANPVIPIPMDKKALKVGDRFLTCLEYRLFWEWLQDNHGTWFTVPAVMLIMLTGQRVEEILRLRDEDYNRAESLIGWPFTKNGRPHLIPLPELAAGVLNDVTPSEGGWFFPHRYKPDRHAISTTPNKLCALYAEETGADRFTPRDLRRTWKTLAGQAGISKEMRDRLQNHALMNDISAKHYDRYDYLKEKREAMRTWNTYVSRIISGELDGAIDSIAGKAA